MSRSLAVDHHDKSLNMALPKSDNRCSGPRGAVAGTVHRSNFTGVAYWGGFALKYFVGRDRCAKGSPPRLHPPKHPLALQSTTGGALTWSRVFKVSVISVAEFQSSSALIQSIWTRKCVWGRPSAAQRSGTARANARGKACRRFAPLATGRQANGKR